MLSWAHASEKRVWGAEKKKNNDTRCKVAPLIKPMLAKIAFGKLKKKILVTEYAKPVQLNAGIAWVGWVLHVSAGSRYDSLGSTRAAKKISHGLRRSREMERLGNGALNPYKSFRTMLLTGSWSHLVSCYAVHDDLRRIGGLFLFTFLNLGASSNSWTTSIGMLPVEELQSDSDDGCDTIQPF